MIPRSVRIELEEALGDGIRFGVPLSRHTSLRIGGDAEALAHPSGREDMARLLSICAEHKVPQRVLGSGFNTLVLDGGIEGVTIQLSRMRRLEERPNAGVRAEAGVSHSQVTRFCTSHGLSGLEFASGIPGSVGGWLSMNAGIPENEMKDVVREIEVMSPTGRHVRHLGRGRLRFVYRALRGLAPGSVILSVLFGVVLSNPDEVRLGVNRLLARRADTQPLNVPSCGSVFQNPPGDHAGRLIEAAGLKGLRIGGAEISPVHANFIANIGGACASDVLALIEAARTKVHKQFGVWLAPEVRIIGRPV